ncbi:hypothetical protein LIER_25291 [Lithospermum erythrorhizon]|uniref:Amidase domain-containing protein n=1 Tax=Lithospermum erythrorhizon TaxID=34254 RepID=A0AAV3R7H7_LITER
MTRLSENPKLWILIGVGVVGIVVLAETTRRRIGTKKSMKKEFGAFVQRFEVLPFAQPPPPSAKFMLTDLVFAIGDNIDVKGYLTGYGNPEWEKTHEASMKTAVVVTNLLKNGATCVGKTVIGELGIGITGENAYYGTPTNPELPTHVPGGSSSGSAVAVAAGFVDFALGTDSIGGVRVPSSFCGVLGFRPSHGLISTIGIRPNSQSLDTVGWFARDPAILSHVGHALLQLKLLAPKRTRQFVVADDLFELTKVPKQKTANVVRNVIERSAGYHPPKYINLAQYIASNVPSLKGFGEEPTDQKVGISTLKALCLVMSQLHSHEFKTNHEEWVKSVACRFRSDISKHFDASLSAKPDKIKLLYKVRTEMRMALQCMLKDDGVLVIPTVSHAPPKMTKKKNILTEFQDRTFALLSIASMSGCCQVSIPLGKHDNCPVSVSFIASHGNDKFLLDTLLDMHASLQEEAITVSTLPPSLDTSSNLNAAELLKAKGNAAYKKRQWNKAVSFYTEAIKLNDQNATYYSNRAAALLELGCFQQAEDDCTKAISLDKKSVKSYLRRGTARESLLLNKEALQDFKHALVLEPQNKLASQSEKRLRKLIG